MHTFTQYQTARAIRDASKQEGGLAGLGAGIALGNQVMNTVQGTLPDSSQNKSGKADMLRELKALLDEGILTQEEFEAEKKQILKN